jgi:hypothetical protein
MSAQQNTQKTLNLFIAKVIPSAPRKIRLGVVLVLGTGFVTDSF